jgi:hypothetical protein
MKQLALDKIFFIPKSLMTALVILSLSLSLSAFAAQSDATATGEQSQTERFNHMSTGFVLTGAHAIAECGSCHVGGVFKGTPRNCSGCHTKGQRVVALSMPSTHLVTTEPCEVCHTNTVTFFGARYNHGKATPGQCASCHNRLTATGRPASHTSLNKATKSCDNCHRTSAWLPSSWNHNGVVSGCVTCHCPTVTACDGSAYFKNNIGGTTPEGFAHGAQNSSIACESCHHSYTTWLVAMYDHASAGTPCSNCHNGNRATGTAQFSGHTSIGTSDCNTCHTTTTTWLGALGGMPANHVATSYFQPSTIACSACHPTASTWITGASLHGYLVSSPCAPCHRTGANVLGAQTHNHNQSKDCGASGCHSSYTTWNR